MKCDLKEMVIYSFQCRKLSLASEAAFNVLYGFCSRRFRQDTARGKKKVSQYRILSKMSLFEALYLLPVDSNMTHSFCSTHITAYSILFVFVPLPNQRCNGRYPGPKCHFSQNGKTPCCSPFQWLLTVFASNEAQ